MIENNTTWFLPQESTWLKLSRSKKKKIAWQAHLANGVLLLMTIKILSGTYNLEQTQMS
jgi:hypothetical protein